MYSLKRSHKLILPFLTVLLLSDTAQSCTQRAVPPPQDKGGFYLIVAVKADSAQLDQVIGQTIAVMRRRCDKLGIYCKLERLSGDKTNQIMLHVSSTMEPARVKSILLAEGLELRRVVSLPSPVPVQTYPTQADAARVAGTDNDVLPSVEEATAGRFVIVERAPIITGQDVRSARAFSRTNNVEGDDYNVLFRLTPDGAARFGAWTNANINKYVAVILNKHVRSVAYIRSQITDTGELSGSFTKQRSTDVANILITGNLPASIELLKEGTYKPSKSAEVAVINSPRNMVLSID